MDRSNYWIGNTVINYYEELLGSRFAAINFIAKLSRKYAESKHNVITHSEALCSVVTQTEPDKLNRRTTSEHEVHNAMDTLNYVASKAIRESVNLSIQESLKQHNLLYLYQDNIQDFEKSRVRILCNLIWDDLLQGGMYGAI